MSGESHSPWEILPAEAGWDLGRLIPAAVTDHGSNASRAFLSFFADQIRNSNTRQAYLRAVRKFFHWAEAKKLSLDDIESFHVSAFVEQLSDSVSVTTVKQNLAALRRLFDWLVVRQIVPANPCHAVRGPSYRIDKGKTSVLDESEAKRLLETVPVDSLVGLRDRAMMAVMTYTFARISATLAMDVADYFPRGKRYWVRLHEKGGREHEMPAHHKLEEYLDAYIEAAGIEDEKRGPLFRAAIGRTGVLSNRRLHRTNAYHAIRKRARQAGISTAVCAHTFRATGITNYLTNGGSISEAQKMAAHADCRTTKLYDRRSDAVSLDEIERISI